MRMKRKKSSIKKVSNNHCEEGEVITNYHYNIKKEKKNILATWTIYDPWKNIEKSPKEATHVTWIAN